MSLQERADVWRDFHDRFMQLGREERGILRAAPREDIKIDLGTIIALEKSALPPKDRFLRAYCNYQEHPAVLERKKPGQGFFSLLSAPPHGLWDYSDGVSENFQARFRVLAARAGLALGCPNGADAEDFWLRRLYLDLVENNSDQLFAASKEGGMILRVCVASATFCSRLERQALEQSHPGSTGGSTGTGANQAEGSIVQNSEKTTQTVESKSTDRKALVKAYIEEVRAKKSKRITRKDIWTAAGYQTRTEFERWERQDPKNPNKAANDTFTRILCIEKPHLK